MGETARISVVIPAFNAANYLPAAIASVRAQTRPADEIVVVDDGSTDDTAAVAERLTPAVRLIRQPNRGAAAARNRGVELAGGGWLAFLDADDMWVPDKLAEQLAAATHRPDLDMVFGWVEQFQSPELTGPTRFRDHGGVMGGPHVGTLLVRAVAFARVGPFRTDLHVGEFIDWYSRATAGGLRAMTLPRVLMRRRLHGGNLMCRASGTAGDFLRIVRDNLRRSRGGD